MSVPFIPIGDITIGRCLGEGSEGVVYAGSYLETPVAIKQLSHVQEMEMNLHIGGAFPYHSQPLCQQPVNEDLRLFQPMPG